jgi:hypothetical protein
MPHLIFLQIIHPGRRRGTWQADPYSPTSTPRHRVRQAHARAFAGVGRAMDEASTTVDDPGVPRAMRERDVRL